MSLSSPELPQNLLPADAAGAENEATKLVEGDNPPPRSAGHIDRLSRGALWVAMGRFLGIGSTILATILVPRLLAPREFGELTSLLSVISFAAIVAQVGLGHSSVRFLSESLALHDHSRLWRTLGLATGVLVLSSFAASGIAALVLWRFGESFFHLNSLLWVTPLAGGLILLMAWQQFTAESLRGLHELRWASLLSGGTFGGPLPVLLFLILLAIVAVQSRPTITTTLFCQIVGSGVSLAVSAVCLRWTLRQFTLDGDFLQLSNSSQSLPLSDLLRVCIPMAVFQFFVIVLQTADIWMAAWYTPLQDVALYGAARRYLVLMNVPTQLAAGTVVASIPNLNARGMTGELQTLLRRSATLTALATLVISPLCLLAGGWLMGSLSGSYYQEAATALAILSMGQIVVSLTGCGGMTLAMTGRQTAAMWVCLGSALFLCIAGPLAARWWGIAGIAAASAGATAIQATAEWLVCRRLVGIWTHADLQPRGLREALGGLLRWLGVIGLSSQARDDFRPGR